MRELRVRSREVQTPVVVLDTVTGKVEQEQVVQPAVLEESGQLPPHDMLWLVRRNLHLEAPDVGVAQDTRQLLRVPGRRAQPAELRIRVVVARDHQRAAGPIHEASLAWRPIQSSTRRS